MISCLICIQNNSCAKSRHRIPILMTILPERFSVPSLISRVWQLPRDIFLRDPLATITICIPLTYQVFIERKLLVCLSDFVLCVCLAFHSSFTAFPTIHDAVCAAPRWANPGLLWDLRQGLLSWNTPQLSFHITSSSEYQNLSSAIVRVCFSGHSVTPRCNPFHLPRLGEVTPLAL